MGSRRAVTLGTTLVVALLVAVLGFCLVSGSLTHLRLVSRGDSSSQALDLARSAVAMAIARLQSGQNQPEVQIAGAKGEGLLSFGSQADAWGIPRSLDNLAGDSSQPGFEGRPLPPYCSQLIAVGRYRGVERRVLALVHLPTFPYAAACEGPLQAPGGLIVARLEPDGEMWPASLRSNADMEIGSGSHIVGDLVATGTILLAPPESVQVDGRLRPHQPAESLLSLDLSQFDPQVLGRPSNDLAPSLGDITLSGLNRASSGLTVTGDLTLQDALVFVEGDLALNGSLRGTGIVVATGDLTLNGHSDLQASSRVGVAAGGTLSVRGQGRHDSMLRGVLYSRQGMDLRQLTVQGSVVSAGSQPARFESVSLLYEEQSARLPGLSAGSGVDEVTVSIMPGGVIQEASTGDTFSKFIAARQTDDLYHVVHMENKLPRSGGLVNTQMDPMPLDDLVDWILASASVQCSPSDLEEYLMARFQPGGSGGPSEQLPSFEPSKLLSLSDRFRVALWEEP